MSVTSPFLSTATRLQTRRAAAERQEFSWRVFVGVLVFGVILWAIFTKAIDHHLLFKDTTPNGGDTGAHVWWPAYLRDHVFNRGRISGWTPDWYAGFPIGRYYMPVPGILIVLLDALPGMPYNVAFKLVSALGPALLPFAAYVFAKGIKAPWPGPPLMAAATMCYLFFTGYSIWGGNLFSNAAGEFSFTIGLALALFFLGTLAMALDTRRRMWLPAAAARAHGDEPRHRVDVRGHRGGAHPLDAQAVQELEVRHRYRPRRVRPWRRCGSSRCSSTRQYTFDMGWTKLHRYWEFLVPDSYEKDTGVRSRATCNGPCVRGGRLVIALFRLRRATLELVAIAGALAVFFMAVPDHARLWNARILPFYYLMIWFLAALGMPSWCCSCAIRDQGRCRVDGGSVVGRARSRRWGSPGAIRPWRGAGPVDARARACNTIQSWYNWNNHGYEEKAESRSTTRS